MTRPTILIYAKPPLIGLAKTRLAKSLGKPATARRIAYMTLSKTMRSTQLIPSRTILLTTPHRALTLSLGGLWPATLKRHLQTPGDLTKKLNQGWKLAPPGKVLFVGADTPDLSSGMIKQAVRTLRTHDAVVGPARDGGFWLFGMNKTHRTQPPFENVRWSSPHTLSDLVRNLTPATRIAYLPEYIDIDEAEDWYRWRRTRVMRNTALSASSPD